MKKLLFLLVLSVLSLGSIHAQDHFTPVDDPFDGTFMLQVWGEVQIDGVSQTSSDIEVGMFLGDDCMASMRIQGYFSNNFYRVKLRCNFDDAGQAVTFKLYNHSEGEEEELECEYSTETTNQDMQLGTNAQNSLVLNFVHETPTPTHEITVTANPAEGGEVTGGGIYDEGDGVTLTATPNEGYTFTNWTLNGEEVSTEASIDITVYEDAEYIANFESTSTELDWTIVDPNNGNYNATLTAIVQINGVLITDGTNWKVGAFCGNICRGVGDLENGWVEIPEESLNDVPYPYYMMMMLYGNNNEVLSFKLANSVTGELHPGVCDVTVTYQNDGDYGDPWEPVILNFVYEECTTLEIEGYGNSEGGYYLIASPVEEELDPIAVGMITDDDDDDYDLYWFNQNPQDEVGLEWMNYKHETFNIENGKGYLYASKNGVTLNFCGTPYEGNGEVTLNNYEGQGDNVEFPGWNLVGNPFPVEATIDRDCYIMNSETGGEIVPSTERTIQPMTGIFVVAENDGETMVFTPQGSDNQGKLVINMLQERGKLIDRAMVRFGESRALPKFMLHANNTKVYIPQNNAEYAVVRSNSENEIPVNFKASQNGTYTLSVNTENVEMQSMYLIDNMTGATIDLLNTPNYQFNATVNDMESRFTISFKSNTSVNTQEVFNPISYRNNGQLLIVGLEGESELQVIDMLGRVISATKINGEHNEMLNAIPGVYTIRLINNDKTYVQKIVID